MILIVYILRARKKKKKKSKANKKQQPQQKKHALDTNEFVLPGTDRSCFIKCLKYR